MFDAKRSLITFLTLALATSGFSITTVHNVLPQSGLGYQFYCDQITWVDGSGHNRVALLANDTVHPVNPAYCGGHMQQFMYTNGSTQKTCYSMSGYGFGSTINHGAMPGSCSGSWLASVCDGYDDTSTFVFKGPHHIIWQYRNKLALHGAGHEPYLMLTRQYVIIDGLDQMQYAISFDASNLSVDTVEPFWDARTPYNEFNWWGDASVYPKNMYGAGTVVKGWVNTEAMTFDMTTPYDLCPYLTAWYNQAGFDDEIGMVQTRLNTKHWAGRDAGNNGKSGALSGVDCFDYQMSDYQGWSGGRTCYMANKPNGANQWPGTTFGTENYSLTMLVGRHSDGGSDRIIAEANAIQNNGTSLTASTGKIQTRGIEGVGIFLTREWDKPGFDQVYRTWNFIASNNIAEGILTIQSGQNIKNPTFVVENYTASSNPAVSLDGASQTDGSGCWISVDTAAHRAWVTFNSVFSGSHTVRFQGASDAVGITISSITVTPSIFLMTQSQQVSVAVTTTGTAPSRVEIDCRSIGGTKANMNGSGSSYSYSVNVPADYPEGDRRLVIRAFGSSGWREADTFVTIKRPDLPLYMDASTATASTWTGNMTTTEKTTGAVEGSKQMEFAFGNGGGAHGGIDFNAPKDFRPYKYLVCSYKGPSTGHPIEFTIGSGNTWATNRYKLPAVTNWTKVALPMRAVTAKCAMEKKTANSIHFWLDTSNGAGTFNFDNFYATSLPDAGTEIPTSVNSFALNSAKNLQSFQMNLHGRMLSLTIPSQCIIRVNDLHGRVIKSFKNSVNQTFTTIALPASGMYLVQISNKTEQLTRRAISR